MCGIKDRRNAHAIRIKITRRESFEVEEDRVRMRERMMGVDDMVKADGDGDGNGNGI